MPNMPHSIEEKMAEKVKELENLEVENYGKWRIDRNLAKAFIRQALQDISTLSDKEGYERGRAEVVREIQSLTLHWKGERKSAANEIIKALALKG